MALTKITTNIIADNAITADKIDQTSLNSAGFHKDGDSVTYENATLTGELRGPASFIIDPAGHGDNTGAVSIKGDLVVEGTTFTANATTVDIADINLTIAHNAPNPAAADGAGITIDGADATLLYNATDDTLDFNKNLSVPGVILPEVTGSGTNSALTITQNNTNIDVQSDDIDIITSGGGRNAPTGSINLTTINTSNYSSGGINLTTGNTSGNTHVGDITFTAGTSNYTGGGGVSAGSVIINAGDTVSTVNNNKQAGSVVISSGVNTANSDLDGSIQLDGKVGIGATNPLRNLHVVGNFAVNNSTTEYYGVNMGGGEGADPFVTIGDWHNNGGRIWWDSSARSLNIDTQYGTNPGTFNITGNDGASNFLTISNAGNVGIGTTSPNAPLHINTGGIDPISTALISSGTRGIAISGVDANIDLLSYDDNTTVATTVGMGRFDSSSGALIDKWGLVSWYDTGNTGSNLSGRLGFHYGTNSDPWNNFEALSITRGGYVGVGTTSPDNQLHISGTVEPYARFENTDGTSQFIDVGTNANGSHFVFGYGSYPLLLGTGGQTRLEISSSGAVTIDGAINGIKSRATSHASFDNNNYYYLCTTECNYNGDSSSADISIYATDNRESVKATISVRNAGGTSQAEVQIYHTTTSGLAIVGQRRSGSNAIIDFYVKALGTTFSYTPRIVVSNLIRGTFVESPLEVTTEDYFYSCDAVEALGLSLNNYEGALLHITRSGGVSSGDLGTIRFGNTDIDSNLANIVAYQDGASNNAGLKFQTQTSGGQSTDRLVINSTGTVSMSGRAQIGTNINITDSSSLPGFLKLAPIYETRIEKRAEGILTISYSNRTTNLRLAIAGGAGKVVELEFITTRSGAERIFGYSKIKFYQYHESDGDFRQLKMLEVENSSADIYQGFELGSDIGWHLSDSPATSTSGSSGSYFNVDIPLTLIPNTSGQGEIYIIANTKGPSPGDLYIGEINV